MKPSLVLRPTLVAVIVAVALAALFPAWQIGERAYRDRQIVHFMRRECHPVWKDLHAGRIRAGQTVEDIIALTKPVRVDRFGNFAILNYQGGDGYIHFTGVTVIASEGRLIDAEAWSCTWRK